MEAQPAWEAESRCPRGQRGVSRPRIPGRLLSLSLGPGSACVRVCVNEHMCVHVFLPILWGFRVAAPLLGLRGKGNQS